MGGGQLRDMQKSPPGFSVRAGSWSGPGCDTRGVRERSPRASRLRPARRRRGRDSLPWQLRLAVILFRPFASAFVIFGSLPSICVRFPRPSFRSRIRSASVSRTRGSAEFWNSLKSWIQPNHHASADTSASPGQKEWVTWAVPVDSGDTAAPLRLSARGRSPSCLALRGSMQWNSAPPGPVTSTIRRIEARGSIRSRCRGVVRAHERRSQAAVLHFLANGLPHDVMCGTDFWVLRKHLRAMKSRGRPDDSIVGFIRRFHSAAFPRDSDVERNHPEVGMTLDPIDESLEPLLCLRLPQRIQALEKNDCWDEDTRFPFARLLERGGRGLSEPGVGRGEPEDGVRIGHEDRLHPSHRIRENTCFFASAMSSSSKRRSARRPPIVGGGGLSRRSCKRPDFEMPVDMRRAFVARPIYSSSLRPDCGPARSLAMVRVLPIRPSDTHRVSSWSIQYERAAPTTPAPQLSVPHREVRG